jgi:hypothetical protein
VWSAHRRELFDPEATRRQAAGFGGLRQMVQSATDEFDVAYRDAPPSADREFIRHLIPFLGDRQV